MHSDNEGQVVRWEELMTTTPRHVEWAQAYKHSPWRKPWDIILQRRSKQPIYHPATMEQSCIDGEGNGLPPKHGSLLLMLHRSGKKFPGVIEGHLVWKIISLWKNVGIAPSYAMGGVVQRRCWFLSHLGLVGDSSSSSEMEASEILWLSLSMWHV